MKINNSVKLVLKQTYTSTTSGMRECFVSDIIKENNLCIGAEIGVRTGRTSFHCLDKNPSLIIHAVDIDISQFYNTTTKEKYGERLIVHEVDSRSSPDFIEDGSLDFYFVDASHTYKNVLKDIQAWTPKLKKDGWMIGHDIDYPSVAKAVLDTVGYYEVGPDNVWFARTGKIYKGLIKL
jgi:hypothetical protein